MRLPFTGSAMLGIAAASAALVSATALSQPAAPGPVRYAMDAATMSGFGAIASGGGGMGAMMAMMGGGGPQPVRTLSLHHGAPVAATKPQADHLMPKGASLGTSLKLLPVTRTVAEGEMSFERPTGRLLLYWGCGAKAGPGQPVVIDFAKVAKGQMPPGLMASAVDLPEDWQLSVAGSRTYTTWPNGDDGKAVPANSSLLGAHRITATYAKPIDFTLAEDFMPPLQATSSDAPGGASKLAWQGLAEATGYYAWAMGARDSGRGGAPTELVWWASSKTQAFGGPLWSWISPAGVQRLITAGTVMPPEQRDCTIPAEVIKAGGEALMVNLQAFGPQSDFAYPPRPADAKKPWNPEWIARVRFRSATTLIPGMEAMGGSVDREDAAETAAPAPRKPKCKGLKGLAQRAAGLCE